TYHGAWTIVRTLLGDQWRPNSLWTRWMIEGLAVYNETKFSRGGRGRGSYYDAILRSAVEHGALNTAEFVTLDMLTGDTPYHPSGENPYLFGYQLFNQIAKDPDLARASKTRDG